MNKREFLTQLRKGLSGLPQEDMAERVTFYSEMIEDRKEEGLSEEEAVAAVGSVQEIVAQAIAETPLTKIAKEKIKPKRRMSAGEIVLLVLGSPIWLSLGVAAVSVILSLYVSLWAVVIALWAVFAAPAACSVGGVLAGAVFTVGGNGASGLAMLAAGMVCAGLSIFAFYGCKAATDGMVILTKKAALWVKHCFMGKEEAQ